MIELLNWICDHPWQAFWIWFFTLTFAAVLISAWRE